MPTSTSRRQPSDERPARQPPLVTQDLVLLGLLRRRPLHGYEVKQVIDRGMSEIAYVPSGTIYYTLKKLERRGWVSAKSARSGNRPERRVYALTRAGRQALGEMLRRALLVDDRPYELFDVCLYFFPEVGADELEHALALRLARIEGIKSRLAKLASDNPFPWPFHLEALRRKGLLLTDAYESWHRELREALAAHVRQSRGTPRAAGAKTRASRQPPARRTTHRVP